MRRVCTGLLATLLAGWSVSGAWGQAEQSKGPNVQRPGPSRPQLQRRQLPGFIQDRPATLPTNVEWVAVRQVDGRVNLATFPVGELGQPIDAQELEQLLARELLSEGVEKATRKISDDQFIRRAYLDIIGQLPSPADIREYANNRSPAKKKQLIEYLLNQEAYGRNWARYWRDVIAYRETAGIDKLLPFAGFEDWLADQFNNNVPWDQIVTDMLTVDGLSSEHPEGFFIAAHDADPAQMAGEVSRIFLGLQIACAECHDHPTDVWKRDQFHELASFFGKTGVRIRRDLPSVMPPIPIVEIGEIRRRRVYRKPNLQDPSDAGEVVQPVFLTGQPIPLQTTQLQRRQALAQFITSKRNLYFAKAFVNRIWAEFMGFGFTNPVDDLGSQQPVAYPEVFEALARSFAASDYDIKQLIRTIAVSRVYDRQFQELDGSYEDEILFTSVAPSPLSADQIFDAVDWVLGHIDDGAILDYRQRSVRASYRQAFGYDPSLDKEELEASIPQALLLMNNPQIHARIDASRPGTLLNKLMRSKQSDTEIVEMLYLRVLARRPQAEEVRTCLDHLKTTGDRAEAFEDLLWALLNSTEFLHNH